MNDDEKVEVGRGDLATLVTLSIRAARLAGYTSVTYSILTDIVRATGPWRALDKAGVMYASVGEKVPVELRRKMCVALTGSDMHTVDFVCETCKDE
jgi:hypothetical protein